MSKTTNIFRGLEVDSDRDSEDERPVNRNKDDKPKRTRPGRKTGGDSKAQTQDLKQKVNYDADQKERRHQRQVKEYSGPTNTDEHPQGDKRSGMVQGQKQKFRKGGAGGYKVKSSNDQPVERDDDNEDNEQTEEQEEQKQKYITLEELYAQKGYNQEDDDEEEKPDNKKNIDKLINQDKLELVESKRDKQIDSNVRKPQAKGKETDTYMLTMNTENSELISFKTSNEQQGGYRKKPFNKGPRRDNRRENKEEQTEEREDDEKKEEPTEEQEDNNNENKRRPQQRRDDNDDRRGGNRPYRKGGQGGNNYRRRDDDNRRDNRDNRNDNKGGFKKGGRQRRREDGGIKLNDDEENFPKLE